jgi:hypothetical protein
MIIFQMCSDALLECNLQLISTFESVNTRLKYFPGTSKAPIKATLSDVGSLLTDRFQRAIRDLLDANDAERQRQVLDIQRMDDKTRKTQASRYAEHCKQRLQHIGINTSDDRSSPAQSLDLPRPSGEDEHDSDAPIEDEQPGPAPRSKELPSSFKRMPAGSWASTEAMELAMNGRVER